MRIATWVTSGVIWGHLFVTLEEAVLGLVVGAVLGITLGFVLARSPLVARICDPVHHDAERRAARRPRADLPAVVRSRHLVEGRAGA